MSYCILIQDKIIREGDTISIQAEGVLNITEIKVLEIDLVTQSFLAILDGYEAEIAIPINIWGNASIIEEKDITDPNILFKLHSGHNDGQ